MASFIEIHLQITELWEKSYYFWIAPRIIDFNLKICTQKIDDINAVRKVAFIKKFHSKPSLPTIAVLKYKGEKTE